MIISRTLQILPLLEKKSHFLFGSRATGKSTLIKSQLPDYLSINLLRNEYYMDLLQAPQNLEAIINAAPNQKIIVIDEVQRIPALLNEVHRLIEERGIHFLLTGSSARKLKQKNTNLLAGRARQAYLFPLTSQEIENFNLRRYLHVGGLPFIYLSEEPYEDLAAYTNTFLKDEIQAEALVRNIPGFSKFLQVAALSCGHMLNFSNVASDVGLPISTIREYYYILEDTFLGFMLPAFTKTLKRKAISTAKFYLFDVGVRHYLTHVKELPQHSEVFGQAFEHFIAMELRAYLAYRRLDHELCYWRSTSGMEVDFLINNEIAIEVKSATRAHDKHLKGLLAFQEEKLARRHILVSLDPIQKKMNSGIELMPWHVFLNLLWANQLIS